MDLSHLVQLVWIGGLAATPIVIGVSLLCRSGKLRPATKHVLWAAALASFLTPLGVAAVWRNAWFASDRVLSLADRVLPIKPSDEEAAPVRGPQAATRSGTPDRGSSGPVLGPSETPAIHSRSPQRSSVPQTPSLTDALPATVWASEPSMDASAGPVLDSIAAQQRDRGSARGTRSVRAKGEYPPAIPSSPALDASPRALHLAAASDHRPSASTIDPTTRAAPAPPTGKPADSATASAPARQAKAWWASLPGGVSRSTRATLEGLVAVRDAIAGLPPVPTYAWIVVAALLVLLRLCRSMALRHIVNRARPAPRRVRELVLEMSGLMGLSSPPETLTTEARVSPMVWCGIRPKLVIPEDLWSSLDDDSRRAVIAHELAHLKRRDHLLHWVAALVGAAYWWHPAAWWARRRMNEEAEASCDAWVTSLFPRRRRAYAEALLVTSSFLGSPAYHAGPALGVVNGRTKLARRITMVMTQRTAPNASKIGVIVASLVLAAGALVTPGLACPPEKEAKATSAPRAAKTRGPSGGAEGGAFLGEAPAIDAMIQAEKAQAEKAKGKSKKKQPGQATILTPSRSEALSDAIAVYREQAASADGLTRASVIDRAQIERAQELARVYAEQATTQGAHASQQAERAAKAYSDAIRRAARLRGPSATTAAPSQPMAPTPPAAPLAPLARTAPVAPTPPAPMNPIAGTASRVRSLDAFGGAATMSGPAEGTEPREYRLPAGKLEALSELMARQDVPIWIERGQGKIVVYATPEQHEIFAAFVKLINPEGGGGLSTPRAAAAALLGGRAVAPAGANVQQLRALLESLESQRDSREEHIDKLRERADELREKAERLREMAEELREQATDAANDAARGALHQAEESLNVQSNGLQSQAADVEAQVAAFESEFEAMEAQIEQLEAQIDSANDAAEETTPEDGDAAEAEEVMSADGFEVTVPEIELDTGDMDLQIPADVLPTPAPVSQPAPAPAAAPRPSPSTSL